MKVCSMVSAGLVAAVLVSFSARAFAQDAGAAAAGDTSAKARDVMREALSFENMDANKDGKVTMEEYKAAAAKLAEIRFKSIDADSDGSLTKEEMEKAREGFRRGGPRAQGGGGRGDRSGNQR